MSTPTPETRKKKRWATHKRRGKRRVWKTRWVKSGKAPSKT